MLHVTDIATILESQSRLKREVFSEIVSMMERKVRSAASLGLLCTMFEIPHYIQQSGAVRPDHVLPVLVNHIVKQGFYVASHGHTLYISWKHVSQMNRQSTS